MIDEDKRREGGDAFSVPLTESSDGIVDPRGPRRVGRSTSSCPGVASAERKLSSTGITERPGRSDRGGKANSRLGDRSYSYFHFSIQGSSVRF